MMEVISWAVEGGPKWIWYITDITNTLQVCHRLAPAPGRTAPPTLLLALKIHKRFVFQGVLIFWIFVLSSKMRGTVFAKIQKLQIHRHSSKTAKTNVTKA